MAVLGGGVGAMTAAFELTRPEHEGRFELTVYQPGWRLGGKGASGRNLARGGRIEEHGLHVWFGFYANAFGVMHDVYEELPDDWPLQSVEQAFKGCDEIVLFDRVGDEWHSHRARWPRVPGNPWEPRELPGFWEIAAEASGWAFKQWLDLRQTLPAGLVDRALDALDPVEWLLQEAHQALLEVAIEGGPELPLGRLEWMVDGLRRFRDWAWGRAIGQAARSPRLKLFLTSLDAFVAMATGVLADDLIERGWNAVDDEEWADWLRRHGASELTLGETPADRAPVLRSVYDVAFGYPGGSIEAADVAAGTATNDLLRLLFTYRGHLFYKMRAGMGDIVFAPLYEVLRRRGVRFRFFNAVTRMGVSDDGQAIEEIDVAPQVDLAPGREEYEPLVDVRGLPCWPSEPLWDQLAPAERLPDTDFEGELNPLGRPEVRLRRGEDFDQVVLGISVGGLPGICDELIGANERFREMVERSVTVRTQAFQLWTRRDSAALGWPSGPGAVAGTYVEPLDTYCDMGDLLEAEDWPQEDDVAGIAYFCGVLEDRAGETQAQAAARVRDGALEFLRADIGPIWPAAADPNRGPGLDWDLLADPERRRGEERFEAQYWRANTSPSERYVLTTAGSVSARLRSGESGFGNLVLAGDWTRNGVDGGCVEAAAVSGIQAATALTGDSREILGQDPRWIDPARTGGAAPEPEGGAAPPSGASRGQPPYVEYGGRATSPGPFLCSGGKLRGLLLRGDEKRIAELVHRTLTAPARGAVEYRSLGASVMLLIGSFESIVCTVPPWDTWGSVRETQASLWVPLVGGRRRGAEFDAERFCMVAPYVLVDNPMSYLGGREDYGYAKTMARFEPAGGDGDRVMVSAYGGDFRKGARADWRPLLEVESGDADDDGGGIGDAFEDAAGFVGHLAGGMLDIAGDVSGAVVGAIAGVVRGQGLEVADRNLLGDLVSSMLAGRGRQVMLKQFRDVTDGTRACYQAVVESPIKVLRVRGWPSLEPWDLTVHHLDSHPIADELGVSSQPATLSFSLELDFVCETGTVVGPG